MQKNIRRSYQKPVFIKSRVSLQKVTAQTTSAGVVTTTTALPLP